MKAVVATRGAEGLTKAQATALFCLLQAKKWEKMARKDRETSHAEPYKQMTEQRASKPEERA